MKIFEWLALLGALAWLPPLLQLIIKQLSKSKLTIIPHRQIEIGYTVNGPILNLSLALSAENKECLVTKIEAVITGPNNETHNLVWQWFEEKIYEIDYSELGLTPVKKQQNAIAIKILKENLVEKKVGFHETVYKIKYDVAYNAANQRYELITNADHDPNEMKATQEYNTLKNVLENSLIWKEGTYKVLIKVGILNSTETFDKVITFHLSANQISRMQSNIQMCVSVLERNYASAEENPIVPWNWIYPNIIE